jgi:SAM-dependent methyltransferase
MTVILRHPEGVVSVEERANGRRRLTIVPSNDELFVPRGECETTYPMALIELILGVKGPAYLCDEILRDEDPGYVQEELERDLLAYFDRRDFDGKRILDFGCGSGASTVVLARMFPSAEVVGVDLFEDLLSVARARMAHYGLDNLRLLQSPEGTQLPDALGRFSFVILSAVYEHLLPGERRTIMPKLWASVASGGYLFINQTPNRLFPIEHHTTGLPLLNYLPRSLARVAALRLSRRTSGNESWETLLRRGIRGGTEGEIMDLLSDVDASPVLIEPRADGIRDRIDLWYAALSPRRLRRTKQSLRVLLKLIHHVSGYALVPNLSLAILKPATQPQ